MAAMSLLNFNACWQNFPKKFNQTFFGITDFSTEKFIE
jgi:hypothetical protein